MKRIAIPVYADRISNRLDCSETLLLCDMDGEQLLHRNAIKLLEGDPAVKLQTLLSLKIDVLICNGITEFFYRSLSKNNVRIIPWMSGEVEAVIDRYRAGALESVNDK